MREPRELSAGRLLKLSAIEEIASARKRNPGRISDVSHDMDIQGSYQAIRRNNAVIDDSSDSDSSTTLQPPNQSSCRSLYPHQLEASKCALTTEGTGANRKSSSSPMQKRLGSINMWTGTIDISYRFSSGLTLGGGSQQGIRGPAPPLEYTPVRPNEIKREGLRTSPVDSRGNLSAEEGIREQFNKTQKVLKDSRLIASLPENGTRLKSKDANLERRLSPPSSNPNHSNAHVDTMDEAALLRRSIHDIKKKLHADALKLANREWLQGDNSDSGAALMKSTRALREEWRVQKEKLARIEAARARLPTV